MQNLKHCLEVYHLCGGNLGSRLLCLIKNASSISMKFVDLLTDKEKNSRALRWIYKLM